MIFSGYIGLSIAAGFLLLIAGLIKVRDQIPRLAYLFFMGSLIAFLSVYLCRRLGLFGFSFPQLSLFMLLPVVALSYVHFTGTIVEINSRERFLQRVLTGNTVFFVLLLYLSRFVSSDQAPVYIFLVWYAVVASLADVFVGLYWSWRKFRSLIELKQARLSIFFMASFILIIAATVNSVYFARYYTVWALALVLPYMLIIRCTFANQHVVLIEKILHEVLIKSVLLAGYSFLYTGIITVLRHWWIVFAPSDLYRIFIEFYLLFVILTYRQAEQFFLRCFERIFFRPVFNYHLLFRNFSQVLLTLVDVNQICRMIVTMFYETYATAAVSCFTYDTNAKEYICKSWEGIEPNELSFPEVHSFVEMVRRRFDVVGKRDIKKARDRESLRLFMALHADICIPFQYRDGMFGFIFLGEKKDGTPYSPDDIELFNVVEGQISVAMNNAYFFKTQKESYELMAQKNKMDAVIALSGGVNHEINNPLSIISMKSQNFLRKVRDSKFTSSDEAIDSAKEIIESCLRNAGRAHMITRRLGDFAKPAKDTVEFEYLDLETYVRGCIELIGERKLAHDNITVAVAIDENARSIYCDKSHLQQILFNIIMNAYHAIGRDGTVSVTGHADDDGMVSVMIQDTGCGIKEDELDKIWEPFYTTKPQQHIPGTKFTGSGLGLALVKRYVEHVGGSISVESTVGVGTLFTVRFPTQPAPENG